MSTNISKANVDKEFLLAQRTGRISAGLKSRYRRIYGTTPVVEHHRGGGFEVKQFKQDPKGQFTKEKGQAAVTGQSIAEVESKPQANNDKYVYEIDGNIQTTGSLSDVPEEATGVVEQKSGRTISKIERTNLIRRQNQVYTQTGRTFEARGQTTGEKIATRSQAGERLTAKDFIPRGGIALNEPNVQTIASSATHARNQEIKKQIEQEKQKQESNSSHGNIPRPTDITGEVVVQSFTSPFILKKKSDIKKPLLTEQPKPTLIQKGESYATGWTRSMGLRPPRVLGRDIYLKGKMYTVGLNQKEQKEHYDYWGYTGEEAPIRIIRAVVQTTVGGKIIGVVGGAAPQFVRYGTSYLPASARNALTTAGTAIKSSKFAQTAFQGLKGTASFVSNEAVLYPAIAARSTYLGYKEGTSTEIVTEIKPPYAQPVQTERRKGFDAGLKEGLTSFAESVVFIKAGEAGFKSTYSKSQKFADRSINKLASKRFDKKLPVKTEKFAYNVKDSPRQEVLDPRKAAALSKSRTGFDPNIEGTFGKPKAVYFPQTGVTKFTGNRFTQATLNPAGTQTIERQVVFSQGKATINYKQIPESRAVIGTPGVQKPTVLIKGLNLDPQALSLLNRAYRTEALLAKGQTQLTGFAKPVDAISSARLSRVAAGTSEKSRSLFDPLFKNSREYPKTNILLRREAQPFTPGKTTILRRGFTGKRGQLRFGGSRSIYKENLDFKLPTETPGIKPPSINDADRLSDFGEDLIRVSPLLLGGKSKSFNVIKPSEGLKIKPSTRSNLKPIGGLEPLSESMSRSRERLKPDQQPLYKPALKIGQRQKQTQVQDQKLTPSQDEKVIPIFAPRRPKTPRSKRINPITPREDIPRPFIFDIDLPKKKKEKKKKKKKFSLFHKAIRKPTASAYAFTAGIKAPEPIEVTKTGLSIRGF